MVGHSHLEVEDCCYQLEVVVAADFVAALYVPGSGAVAPTLQL